MRSEQYLQVLVENYQRINTLLNDPTIKFKQVQALFEELNLIKYNQFDSFIIQSIHIIDKELYTIPIFFEFKTYHLECIDQETQMRCNLQVIEFHSNQLNASIWLHLKILIEFQMYQMICVETPRWPIYLTKSKFNNGIQQLIIPSSKFCFSLEDVINNFDLMKVLCFHQNLNFEDYLPILILQILNCIYQMHYLFVAHRNIKPFNIIYSNDNQQWKLRNLDKAFKYQNQCYKDYYDIIGDSAFLNPKLNTIRENQHISKIQPIKVYQNLYQNDLYAFAVSIEYLIKEKNSPILKYLNMLKKVPDFKALEQLNNNFVLFKQENYEKFLQVNNLFNRFISQKQVDSQLVNNKWSLSKQLIHQIKQKKSKEMIYVVHLIEDEQLQSLENLDQILSKDFSIFKLNNLIQRYVYYIEKPQLYKNINPTHLIQIIKKQIEKGESLYLFFLINFNKAVYYFLIAKQFEQALIKFLKLKKKIKEFQMTSAMLYLSLLIEKMILNCYKQSELIDQQQYTKITIIQKQFEHYGLIFKFDEMQNRYFSKNSLTFSEILAPILYYTPLIQKQFRLITMNYKIKGYNEKIFALLGQFYDFLDYYNKQQYQVQALKILSPDELLLNPLIQFDQLEQKEDQESLTLEKAKVFAQIGFPKKALKMLEQLESLNSKDIRVLELICLCFYQMNLIKDALSLLETNQLLQQKMIFIYSRILMKNKKYQQVQSIFSDVSLIKLLPPLQQIKIMRYLHQYSEALEYALKNLELVIKQDSLHSIQAAMILFEISKIYLANNQTDKAMKEFKSSQLNFINHYTIKDFFNIYAFLRLFVGQQETKFFLIKQWFCLIFGQTWNQKLNLQIGEIKIEKKKIVKNSIRLIQIKLCEQKKLLEQDQFIISSEIILDQFINQKQLKQKYKMIMQRLKQEEFYEIRNKLKDWIQQI